MKLCVLIFVSSHICITTDKSFSLNALITVLPLQKIQVCLTDRIIDPKNRKYKDRPFRYFRIKMIGLIWSEWRESNPRPHGPEPCALPTALHPDSYIIIVVLPVSVKGGVWPFLGKTGSGKRKSPTEVGLFESTITCCTERRYPWRS